MVIEKVPRCPLPLRVPTFPSPPFPLPTSPYSGPALAIGRLTSPRLSAKAWDNWSNNYTSCAIKSKAEADNNLINFGVANCGSQQSTNGCTMPASQANCGRDLTSYTQSLLSKNYGTASSTFTSNEYWAYARQTSACSSYATSSSSTTSSSGPAALESFPFSQIHPATNDTTALVDSIDLRDFIPALWRLEDQTTNPTVTDRPDIVALSSARQVLGVDYPVGGNSASGSNLLKGGLLLAKGAKVVEHNIATCARFLGGQVLAVQQSLFGIDAVSNATTGPHVMNVGSVNQVDPARGQVFATSFVVLVTRTSSGSNDFRMDVYQAWDPTATPALIMEARGIDVASLSPADLAFVTVQLWCSVSHKPFFYILASAALDQLSSAQIPVHYHFLLDRADPALVPSLNGTQIQLRDSGSKPTSALASPAAGSDSSTVPLSEQVYAWVEELAFQFPARLTMRIKVLHLPRLSSVNLTIIGFSSSSQPSSFTNTTLVAPSLFSLTSESIGGQSVWSHEETVDLTQLLDVVVTVTGKLSATEGVGGGNSNGALSPAYLEASTQDKTYSNSGFFYVSHVDTNNGNAVSTPFARLDASTVASIPSLSLNGARTVPLAGSVSTVATSSTRTQTIVRGLTPHSDPVDLSGYGGVQFFVRVRGAGEKSNEAGTNYTSSAISLIVSLDSRSDGSDASSLLSTSSISLVQFNCWYAFNIPWSAFTSDQISLTAVKALLFTLTPSDQFFRNGGDPNSFINSVGGGAASTTPTLIPIGDITRAAVAGTTPDREGEWVYEIAKIALDQQYQDQTTNIAASSGVCISKVATESTTSNQGPKLNASGRIIQSGWQWAITCATAATAMVMGMMLGM